MTVEEYVGQSEHYFSESSGQLLRIDQMPFPHLYYSHQKLLETIGHEFISSNLDMAMCNILYPYTNDLAAQLEKYSSASHGIWSKAHIPAVRSKFYRAGKKLGVKIHTKQNGKWMTGEVRSPKVKLQGKVIS